MNQILNTRRAQKLPLSINTRRGHSYEWLREIGVAVAVTIGCYVMIAGGVALVVAIASL